MFHRAFSAGTIAMLLSLSACGGDELTTPEQEDEVGSASQEIFTQGIYTKAKITSGFPLGQCGDNTTTGDTQLNEWNTAYDMEWVGDSCVKFTEKSGGCSSGNSITECEAQKLKPRKIVTPLRANYTECLTPDLLAATGGATPTTTQFAATVGSITVQPDGKALKSGFGYMAVFRHNGNYQYELVSGASGTNFMGQYNAKAPTTDTITTLNNTTICFVPNYKSVPIGKTIQWCTGFASEATADTRFPGTNDTHAAFSMYDPATHAYCATDFGLRTAPWTP